MMSLYGFKITVPKVLIVSTPLLFLAKGLLWLCVGANKKDNLAINAKIGIPGIHIVTQALHWINPVSVWKKFIVVCTR